MLGFLTYIHYICNMLTIIQLKACLPSTTEENITKFIEPLNETLVKYKINTPERIAAFLSQIFHESLDLKILSENLNYSSEGLIKTFPKYFNKSTALLYQRNPQKIANRVYASRMGNGPESSGDGWQFRGRGAIQTTGRDNYTLLSRNLGVDFINNPDLLKDLKYAVLSAGWFWSNNNLNSVADKGDITRVSKIVNGGSHGLPDRIARYKKYLKVLSS